MIPWRPLLVFLGISVATTTAFAVLSASMGWSVRTPAWAVLAPIAMWAPAVGRYAARRSVDRGFTDVPAGPRVVPGPHALACGLLSQLPHYNRAVAVPEALRRRRERAVARRRRDSPCGGLRHRGIDALSLDAPARTVVAGARPPRHGHVRNGGDTLRRQPVNR